MRAQWLRATLAAAVLAAVIWLFASGAYQQLDAEAMRSGLLRAGAWGPLLYLLAFATIQPLGPSGHIFVIAASLVWSPWVAFPLALTGATLAQTSGFVFYRYLARDWAQARIPARLRQYERALIERPVRTVMLIRLMTFTWPLVPALLGTSRVRMRPMLAATPLGLAPMVAVDVWLGGQLSAWLFG